MNWNKAEAVRRMIGLHIVTEVRDTNKDPTGRSESESANCGEKGGVYGRVIEAGQDI